MLSQQHKKINTLSLYVKLSAIFFLLGLSILIVACSGSNSSQLIPVTPVATVTINLGQVIGSPTPPLKDYYCGGWATDTSPAFSATNVVSVFGKFTHIDDYGNPEGVAGASATATIHWPDGTTDTMIVTTTSDGLAVFPVAIKASALNKVVTIEITFTASVNGQNVSCSIPSAAYFTAILVSPTPSNTAMPSATNSATPSDTPTPPGIPTPPGTPTHCRKCTPTAIPSVSTGTKPGG